MRSSQLGVGVVGYGYWGPNLVRNFAGSTAARVVAVADLDPLRLAALTRNHPARAEGLAQRFQAIDGVLSTQISERTRSLTILYDPQRVGLEALYQVVEPAAAKPPDSGAISHRQATRVAKAGEMFGKAAFDVFVAKALERSVVSLLAALR
jgi:hypothetical protein